MEEGEVVHKEYEGKREQRVYGLVWREGSTNRVRRDRGSE